MYLLCLLNIEAKEQKGARTDIMHQGCSSFGARLLLLSHDKAYTLQRHICQES